MKEKELAHVLRSSENEEYIGILIINDQRKILLHKSPQWESPYVLSHNPVLAKPREVAHHFLTALAIEAELYEAFISPAKHTLDIMHHVDHLIIAIINTETTEHINQITPSVWLPFEFVIHDVHEQPDTYAPWLCDSIDGIALYLKNLLKQSKLLAVQQAELS
ncbi:hypothetical protein FJ365_04640 [Candidatus Dependentiae bacterium]|nr:hypothetical protein [Candidatus Dependentiae bacterium]